MIIETDKESFIDDNVTRNEFDEFKTNISDIKAEVQTVQDTISMPLGMGINDVATVTAVLAFFELFALIFLFVALLNTNEKVRELHSKLRGQTETSRELSNQVILLEDEINAIRSYSEKKYSEPTVNKTPPPKYKAFVDDFNELASKAASLKADEFIKKYNVKSFSCSNVDARMKEPIPAPEFATAKDADFLAYEYEPDCYSVVPSFNVKNYTKNQHIARAMSDVFNSNFEENKTYTKIFVESPAEFECEGNVWKIKRQGKLKLE